MTSRQFRPPSPLNPDALINSADRAVNQAPPGGPSREEIHRAVSTSYYAVFHAITTSNADTRHGTPTNAAGANAWTSTYRAMRHTFAGNSLGQHLFTLSQTARLLATIFINLKNARETADYDPNRTVPFGDAIYWIANARAALTALQNLTTAERVTISNITLNGNP